MLGVVCNQRRAFADAVSFLTRAVDVRQDLPQLHGNLGYAWMGLRLHAQAEIAYRRAIALGGPDPARLNDLGTALAGSGGEAEAAYRQALALRPDFAPARYNLANLLVRLDRLEEAVQEYQVVLDAVPSDPARQDEVAGALAATLGKRRHYDQAEAVCRAVLAGRPDSATMAWNLALALLCRGNFAEGWQRYEARWLVPTHEPAPAGTKVLDLEQVAGRDVLVLAEQGRGDILQFARYAPLLSDRGARVTLQVYPDLAPVLASLRDVRVITLENALPRADLTTPLLSLPLAFGTTLATIPADVPYLRAPPDRVALWRERLGPRMRPRIGLAWRGLQHIPERSMRADALAPLLTHDADFHAVHKEITPIDGAWLACHGIVDHSAALADFGDTAALLSLMDLIITIDTAVAHLAGALGLPFWVMLPFNADWRWLTDRDDSPWYPTARLFRQTTRGDWDEVTARIAGALARCCLR
jgi:tetratricopeptide (TPR) repeat protein